MARDKCTLTDAELIEKARDWISKLAKSGGREWCLRVPVDFNHDSDMIFFELCNRLEGAQNIEQANQPENGQQVCTNKGCAGYSNGYCTSFENCPVKAVSG